MVFKQFEINGMYVWGRYGGVVVYGYRVIYVRRFFFRYENVLVNLVYGFCYFWSGNFFIFLQRFYQIFVVWYLFILQVLYEKYILKISIKKSIFVIDIDY